MCCAICFAGLFVLFGFYLFSLEECCILWKLQKLKENEKKKRKEKEVPSKELMKLALAHGKVVRSQGEEGLNKILILSKKRKEKQQDFDDILMEHGSHLPTVASTIHSHFFFPNFHLIFFVGNSI